jgi:DNA-binding transcriptional LysR family regulator
MELRHLRYFVAVAEECHFGRAAERLHMAQPPLSQQIRQLEAELGVELLHRTTRKVSLTAAGARYLERARAVLAAVEHAGEEVGRVAAGEIGRVAIGFIGSATYALLPQLARQLREEFPDINFDFKGEMLTPDQTVALHDGTIDIALMRTPVRDPDLEVRVLRRESLVVAVPEQHPLARVETVRIAQLRDEPFITYPSGHRSVLHDAVLGACQRAGFQPRQVVQVAETSTLVVFVAAGIGVALVPESVRELRVTGAVFRPLQDVEQVELAIGWRADKESVALARVVEHIMKLLAE